MSHNNTKHPSVYEELNRKVVDALVWLEESQASGELTPEQAYAARQALFIAVSGLLSSDVNALLSSAAHSNSAVHQEVCIKDNTIAVLTMSDHGNVMVHRAPIDTLNMTVSNFTANDKPFRLLKKVKQRLVESGYHKFI